MVQIHGLKPVGNSIKHLVRAVEEDGRRLDWLLLTTADGCGRLRTAAVIRNEVGGRPRGARRAAKTSSAAGRRAVGRRSCDHRNSRGQAHGQQEDVGGNLKDPAEAYRGSRTARGAESRAGYHSIRQRLGGGGEATGVTGVEGGGGGGDVGWWRHRQQGFGRSRRWIPAGCSSGKRTGAGGNGNEVAVGRSRAAAGFGPDACRDVYLHREVLHFTSRGGRGPIFLHMDRLLEQRFLPQTVQKLGIFTFRPSIGDALSILL